MLTDTNYAENNWMQWLPACLAGGGGDINNRHIMRGGKKRKVPKITIVLMYDNRIHSLEK